MRNPIKRKKSGRVLNIEKVSRQERILFYEDPKGGLSVPHLLVLQSVSLEKERTHLSRCLRKLVPNSLTSV